MKENRIINLKGLKKEFENQGIKIGREAILKFNKIEESKIKEEIKRLERKANLLGRKVIREDDLS